MMYPEVKAGMVRKRVTLAKITSDPRVKCTSNTLCQKLNGKYPILLSEAIAIKDILESDLSIEELFKVEVVEK